MQTTRALNLFQNNELVGLLSWFYENAKETRHLRVTTINGRTFEGRIVQVTSHYCVVSHGDPQTESDLTAAIIPLSGISSVEFTLDDASSAGAARAWPEAGEPPVVA
ncbi:hypothetical protein [Methylobacterium sp. 391_Methyba4]|uniref:hypothetical protein n=1 Tax=Methylobacterium sp. 391_Methyba4 TaxID=3038924 RepID=UPI00241D18C2|nr:hypothetical protein [Methylobacterium sp. 391_Methyba4]WFS07661.1 hypothetical protein P9K36_30670 [Methylobacterium sp. 391_Methyba4]